MPGLRVQNPRIFSCLRVAGEGFGGGGASPGAPGPPPAGRDGDVVSLPVLGRLIATRDFRDVLQRQRRLLDSAAGAPPGVGFRVLGSLTLSTHSAASCVALLVRPQE